MSYQKRSRVVIMIYGLCGCWHDEDAEDLQYLGQPDGCIYGERSDGDNNCKHAVYKNKQWRCNNHKALLETHREQDKSKQKK